MRLEFIELGKPVQNAYVESFNGSLRDECLNANWFYRSGDVRQKSKPGGKITNSYVRIACWTTCCRQSLPGKRRRVWKVMVSSLAADGGLPFNSR